MFWCATKDIPFSRIYLTLVLALTTVIAIGLAAETQGINPWPTDSDYFYIPTAANLFSLPHLSDMHNIPSAGTLGRVNMHGKESLVFLIAVAQKILGDERS